MKRGYMDRPWHSKMKEAQMTDKMTANDGKAMSAKLNRLIGIWRDNCQRLYRHEGRVCKENCPDYTVCQAAPATLEALAESEAGLRAENAALKQEVERAGKQAWDEISRLEQENLKLQQKLATRAAAYDPMARLEDVQAELSSLRSELDKAKPLIEAVEKATERDLHVEYFGEMTATSLAVLRAALAYRAGREGK